MMQIFVVCEVIRAVEDGHWSDKGFMAPSITLRRLHPQTQVHGAIFIE
jgi:hypothetical protein